MTQLSRAALLGSIPENVIGMYKSSRYLSSGPAGEKSVIRVFEPKQSRPSVIIKAFPEETGARGVTDSELSVLTFLRKHSSTECELRFSAPVPSASFGQTGWRFTVQSVAPGQPLSELIFLRARRRRWDFLQHELCQCALLATTVPDILGRDLPSHKISADWYKIPSVIERCSETDELVALEAERQAQEGLCAHGDFTIENVFWDSTNEEAAVIDWGFPIQGVPRLYDAITLLLSALPALALEHREVSSEDDRLERQFEAAFFGIGPWAVATRAILRNISSNLPGPSTNVWREFLLSLAIRTNYFFWRQPGCGRQYARLLQYAVQHKQAFVCATAP